ncbi:MAG: YggS family pyridoxal phosphate-dependent enzyme [Desulfurivibrionaceae bacterium]|nr:YggS family pyridoxal phosphate-dependent enzyme [Desulfurivibrionaceae bacterium]
MTRIKHNLQLIQARIEKAARRAGRPPEAVRLVAVSKKQPVELIREAFACGQTLFGENYPQEAAEKIARLDRAIAWHFIGHLQSNKAATAAALFDMVQTVDRLKIARALDRSLAESGGRIMPILIQVNIGREPQKAGIAPEDCAGLLKSILDLKHLRVRGLMIMPPFHDDPEETRPYFRQTRELASSLCGQGLLAADGGGVELSMGMSGDYETAIEEGATLVRIGSALFGERK